MKYLLMSLLAVLSFNVTAERVWNVDEVLTMLQSDRAIDFVNSIKPEDDWDEYESLLNEIKLGDPKWLEVGVILASYTDAGISMGVSITFAQALKNNPEAVLSTMSEQDVIWSCSVPLIEPTKKDFYYFVNSTLTAVSEINTEQLLEKKELCLKQLQQAKDRYRKL